MSHGGGRRLTNGTSTFASAKFRICRDGRPTDIDAARITTADGFVGMEDAGCLCFCAPLIDPAEASSALVPLLSAPSAHPVPSSAHLFGHPFGMLRSLIVNKRYFSSAPVEERLPRRVTTSRVTRNAKSIGLSCEG